MQVELKKSFQKLKNLDKEHLLLGQNETDSRMLVVPLLLLWVIKKIILQKLSKWQTMQTTSGCKA